MTVNHGGVATEQREEVLRSIQAQHGEPKEKHTVWCAFLYLDTLFLHSCVIIKLKGVIL